MTVAPLAGIFAVKLPVCDLAVSRSWYERLFDLRLMFEFPDEQGVVRGVGYEVPGLSGAGLADHPVQPRAPRRRRGGGRACRAAPRHGTIRGGVVGRGGAGNG